MHVKFQTLKFIFLNSQLYFFKWQTRNALPSQMPTYQVDQWKVMNSIRPEQPALGQWEVCDEQSDETWRQLMLQLQPCDVYSDEHFKHTHTHCAVRLYMKQYRIAVEKFIQTCYKSICLNVSYHSRCAKSMCSKQAICTSSQLQQQHLRASNERNKQSLGPNTIEEKDHSIITIVGCRTAVTIKSCYCWIPSFSWQNVVTCTTISVVGWQQHTLHHSSDSTMYRCMLQNYSNY